MKWRKWLVYAPDDFITVPLNLGLWSRKFKFNLIWLINRENLHVKKNPKQMRRGSTVWAMNRNLALWLWSLTSSTVWAERPPVSVAVTVTRYFPCSVKSSGSVVLWKVEETVSVCSSHSVSLWGQICCHCVSLFSAFCVFLVFLFLSLLWSFCLS